MKRRVTWSIVVIIVILTWYVFIITDDGILASKALSILSFKVLRALFVVAYAACGLIDSDGAVSRYPSVQETTITDATDKRPIVSLLIGYFILYLLFRFM